MDARRFSELYATLGVATYSRCRRLLGEDAGAKAADAATREVFVRAHRRVLASNAEEALRSIYRASTMYCLTELGLPAPARNDEVPAVRDAPRAIPRRMADRDLARRLVASAPEHVRGAGWCYHVDHLDLRDVASILGTSRANAAGDLTEFASHAASCGMPAEASESSDEDSRGVPRDGHPSAIELDRLAFGVGESTAVTDARVAEHLAICDACLAERRAREQHATEFRRNFGASLAGALRRAGLASGWFPAAIRRRAAWLGVAAVAVAAGLAVAHLRESRAQSFETQAKGDFDIVVFARHEGRIDQLDRYNRWVYPGDEVRFVLTGTPDGYPHLVVGSVDGAGQASIYFPYGGRTSAPIPGPGRWEIPGSIQLDDGLGPERVFALFSKTPFSVAAAEKGLSALGRQGPNAIRDARTIDLADTVQRSFLMMKRSRDKAPAR